MPFDATVNANAKDVRKDLIVVVVVVVVYWVWGIGDGSVLLANEDVCAWGAACGRKVVCMRFATRGLLSSYLHPGK